MDWLKENQIDFLFHNYKKNGLSEEKFTQWLSQKSWEELLNRAGSTWKQLPEEARPQTPETAMALALEKPSVVRRPLIEKEGKIVALGFKVSDYQNIFTTELS
jgi:arsenate reductase